MEDLSERAVQIARARYPGRPEVARAVSLRFQTGDVPAHVLAGHLTAGPKAADALVSPEVRQDMHLAAFIDRVAQTLPAVAPAVVLRLSELPRAHEVPAKPVQRSEYREAAILEELRRMGFDPLALPTVPSGKASPEKAAVRAALAWPESTAFDHAWKRLTRSKQIMPR
jgi:hypothetical protein